MKRSHAVILAFLLTLLLVLAASAEELDESRRNLEAIQARIEQASDDLQQKQATATSLTADLKTVDRAVARLRARLAKLSRKVAALERDIALKEDEVAAARAAVGSLEGKVRQRLAALYKSGEMGFLRVLFAMESPARRAEEYDYLGRVVRRDRELLTDYRRQVVELEASLQQLSVLRQEQQVTLAAERGNRETLEQAQRLKKELLAKVRRDEAALTALLEQLRQRAARLAALIKKLETEKSREYTEKTGLFAGEKGRLPWPAAGPVKVGFGTWRHPELGTHYDSQGLEIVAAVETPIKAVWPGRVIFANRFQGYGNLLIVDHGDSYYTLYAQASRLARKVGDPVSAGEVLARSGFDGNDAFYFEIRHRGTPLDPVAWLAPR